jgi:hypothetical protein
VSANRSVNRIAWSVCHSSKAPASSTVEHGHNLAAFDRWKADNAEDALFP